MKFLMLLSTCLAAATAQYNVGGGGGFANSFANSYAGASSGANTGFGPSQVTIEESRPLLTHNVKIAGASPDLDILNNAPIFKSESYAAAVAAAGAAAGASARGCRQELLLPRVARLRFGGRQANARAYVEIKPKTHYKVLFIRAPSVSAAALAKVRAAVRSQTQEKTLVYVISSAEADANSLVDAAAVDTYQSAQPEVRFVNYKGHMLARFKAEPEVDPLPKLELQLAPELVQAISICPESRSTVPELDPLPELELQLAPELVQAISVCPESRSTVPEVDPLPELELQLAPELVQDSTTVSMVDPSPGQVLLLEQAGRPLNGSSTTDRMPQELQ
ncbi:hypothetical protein quinque_000182 [Culex quinquefasciatus]